MTPADQAPADAGVPDVLTLAGDFPQPTREQWDAEVLKVLNRRRPEDKQLTLEECMAKLRSHTVEGLEIEPLYLNDDRPLGYPGVSPFRRGSTVRSGAAEAWDVRQLHDDPDAGTSRAAVLADLERGVTSLWLKLGPAAIGYADLAAVLTDVQLELAPVAVSSQDDQVRAATALLQVWADRGTPADKRAGNLGLDPIGYAAQHATTPDLSRNAEFVRACLSEQPGVRALIVDATVYHDAGAADVDELAVALATGVEYLRDLEAAGVPVGDAFAQLDFRVSANADQFLTIARLRALRELWARVGEVVGVDAAQRGARQHAVTSARMLTRTDPYVNMLRVTTATFAAAAGGAEQITVLPFDHAYGLPDVFSRRIARNTQVVLAEESNIGRVNDPAGGSWYVERLTDQLVAAAWTAFQEIEAAGGMTAALGSGLIADQIATSVGERARRIATRQAPITGTSMFPNGDEQPLVARPRPAVELAGLAPIRDSAVYEDLRAGALAYAAQHGARPAVFLATIGLRRDYGARETFTSSLLAAAAFATPATEGTDPQAMVDGFTAAGTSVAVLCSSATMYAAHGAEIARALRAAGATKILLAGSAKELGDPDASALIDDYIYAGMDAVALLRGLQAELGVAQ